MNRNNLLVLIFVVVLSFNFLLLYYSHALFKKSSTGRGAVPTEVVDHNQLALLNYDFIEDKEPEAIVHIDNRDLRSIQKSIQRDLLDGDNATSRNLIVTFPIQSLAVDLNRLKIILEKLSVELEGWNQQNHLLEERNRILVKVFVVYSNQKTFSEQVQFQRLLQYYQEYHRDLFEFVEDTVIPDDINDFENDYSHRIPGSTSSNQKSQIENYQYNKPNKASRQHNLNVVATLRHLISKRYSKDAFNQTRDYIFMMNDLIPVCDSSFSVISYLLRKTQVYNPDWKVIKLSQNWSGFIMHQRDIVSLEKYIYGNRHIKKSKDLLEEWICGMSETGLQRTGICRESNRNLFIFRYNLFQDEHFEDSICWATYIHSRTCLNDDLVPCLNLNLNSTFFQLNLNSELAYLNYYLSINYSSNSNFQIQFRPRTSPIPIYTKSPLNNFSNSLNDSSTSTESNTHGILFILFILVTILIGISLFITKKKKSLK
ncbi:hypothetical protein DLAC_05035 [Tieghemostelium lacteum]|uniref:Uncharacterized protein n=1 Tax=Tieghemostelium lacteum TaxID=361077 RepID=A0A151ZI40_TIELA|nr:hypothetical protein DLAC_05035 [Tieghemostelium lacteum]|eukprot:KYQ93652.1 hypothetical protein DLAC_05035 [Tieghemostelium lacteum]